MIIMRTAISSMIEFLYYFKGSVIMKRLRFLLLSLCMALIASPALAVEEPKERLVVMQVQGKGVSPDERRIYRNAVVEALSWKYEVLSGDEVDATVQEIFEKESRESIECDTEKCFQDIAIEFQAELIATTTVLKVSGGFMLTVAISNVLENRALFTRSQPCKGCDQFAIINVLKSMAGGVGVAGDAQPVQPQAGPAPTRTVRPGSLDDLLARQEQKEKQATQREDELKTDIEKYEKLAARGEDGLKVMAWNALIQKYPQAGGVEIGDTYGLTAALGLAKVAKVEEINVTLGTGSGGNGLLGVVIDDYQGLTGIDTNKGALVVYVSQGSAAEKSGIKIGNVITSVGETPINNYSELPAVISSYRGGDSVKITVVKIRVNDIRELAEESDGAAQQMLGEIYRESKDYEEAFKWYRKAAEQGYANAQTILGSIYANGLGVSKDIKEAVRWYRKAAEQGNANAQGNLKRFER